MQWDEVCRRAGGRRHYNSVRQFRAALRRTELAHLLVTGAVGSPFFDRGTQRRLADRLGVSETTISRDIATLLKEMHRS